MFIIPLAAVVGRGEWDSWRRRDCAGAEVAGIGRGRMTRIREDRILR